MTNSLKSKLRYVLVVGLIFIVMLSGVLLTNGRTTNNTSPSSSTSNAEALFKYKTAYVGDNSKVINLIGNLAFADLRKEVSLQTQTAPYGITANYDLSNLKLDRQQIETTFRHNAVIMFALIKNVEKITFNVSGTGEQPKYQFSRAEVQKDFANDLREYSAEIKSFDTFLKDLTFRLLVFPGKYTPLMSSTPGIRISAEYHGSSSVGKVRYSTENGGLFTWDVPTGKMTKGVSTIELPYDGTVYWSPFDQNRLMGKDDVITVNVTLLDEKGKQVAEKQVVIIYDGTLFYSVKSSSGIVIT